MQSDKDEYRVIVRGVKYEGAESVREKIKDRADWTILKYFWSRRVYELGTDD